MNQHLLQLGRQLSAIWKQLGLNQRISIVLAALVVLGGLLALGLWSSRVDYSLLYGKLDEAEAAKLVAALDELGVPYKLATGGRSILVPADKVHSVRMQLASKGIPRGEGVGFEIFDKPNFGISDFVQRANYVRAIQGELARTISELDEIEAARVMIVVPENRLLVDNKKHPTASVFVRVRGNGPLPAQAVNSIRFLVANSVEGLQANHVTVVDNLGNVLSENSEDDSITGMTSSQLAARRNLEQYLARKAEGMLEKVLGPGQAVVRVAAEINLDTVSRVEENFDPESTAVRSDTINDENSETASMSPGTGGVPGVSINSLADATNSFASPNPGSPTTSTTLRKKIVNKQYEISRTTSNILQTAGGLKRVSAAVFVAQRFEGSGADRKPVPRSEDELRKLERIVASALGIQSDNNSRQDEITLVEMPFNEQPAIEVTQELQKQERRQFWWQLGSSLIYPVLGLAILFAFWRAFKKTPAESIPIGIPLGQVGRNGSNGNGNGNGDGNGHGSPEVTVEVLNRLIKENPNNMTQAIRSWMTRGTSNPK